MCRPQSTDSSALIGLALMLAATPARAQPPSVDTVVVASGFDQAIKAADANDGTGRLFVVERPGRIRIWDRSQVLTAPFLDISALIAVGGEGGLLGLAFHPDYATNGLFYVHYTDLGSDSVIARYSVSSGDPNIADAASAQLVLTYDQPYDNHNGGDLAFDPNGFLAISSGDGGGPASNSQDTSNLLGKILRVDIDGDDFPGDPNRNYAIPPDNPFVGVGGAAPEIWVLGLRNPFRFSFDRGTGDILIGDVGEGAWEEADWLPAGAIGGANLGWPCYEGDDVFDLTNCGPPTDYVFPVAALPHDRPPDNNCSIIGGYRYRGADFPSLQGWYFYKDWCTGTLHAARPTSVEGGAWESFAVDQPGSFTFTGFGEDAAGELYLAGGFELLRVIDPTGVFSDGFETGDTSAWSATVP